MRALRDRLEARLLLSGVFVTALYSFRLVFMTFHGKERMDEHTREHLHESPWVVTVPLVLLAIPSVIIGWMTVGPVLFGRPPFTGYKYSGGAVTINVLANDSDPDGNPLTVIADGATKCAPAFACETAMRPRAA